ncbi:MAG TPA: acyl-CoA dehydrogenase family protein [Streptosporangiaceae bacterium]|jgi:alkylation response protein AidB-like acyl-CoA dehydrogenase|nr:acyl-CoA dehydrogenase family protein [Streptosporangiaceae bacterium]
MSYGGGDLESVESFRERAREWIAGNLAPVSSAASQGPDAGAGGRGEAAWLHARRLQARLNAGGFAGICYPRQYGGLGLTPAHQRAFNEEVAGYEMPILLNTPTFTICGPTILDMGSEEQKREHLAAAIRGDEVLVQFLSEPAGGSDLAGSTTRATRDGDVFILSGSKIWSSAAYAADYALCLARTDWEVPKHRGLTMFLLKVGQPGIQIHRIRQVDGSSEFCQEFFDDVEVPLSAVVGEINGGWAVALRQLFHERVAVGGGSPYYSGPAQSVRQDSPVEDLIDLVRRAGRDGDACARELVAEFHALGKIHAHLVDRVAAGMRSGQLPPEAGSLIRLFSGESATRRAEIALELAGPAAAISGPAVPSEPDIGVRFLFRQASSLGGGSTEMARNIISERMLGMPREYAPDRDVPFSQVKRGR